MSVFLALAQHQARVLPTVVADRTSPMLCCTMGTPYCMPDPSAISQTSKPWDLSQASRLPDCRFIALPERFGRPARVLYTPWRSFPLPGVPPSFCGRASPSVRLLPQESLASPARSASLPARCLVPSARPKSFGAAMPAGLLAPPAYAWHAPGCPLSC